MGRRFTTGSSERIHHGTAAALMGLDFRYGTAAVCGMITSATSAGTFFTTNDGTGATFDFLIGATTSRLGFYDNTNFAEMTTAVTLNEPVIMTCTRTTGSANVNFGWFRFSTGAWVRQTVAAGSAIDSAANTSLTLGAFGNTAPSDYLDGDMWAFALWPQRVLPTGELDRLPSGRWDRWNPAFLQQYSDGREVGDTGWTLGRNPARQTARTGTTRGARMPPPGFKMSVARRRR